MPINGLLINLIADEELAKETVSLLEQSGKLELGELTDRWLPVVVEASHTGASHDVHEWIDALPGVVSVDVIFASVEQPNQNKVEKIEV